MEHRGWYRRRLPHFDQGGEVQFVTFSLIGTHVTIPKELLEYATSQQDSHRDPNAPQWMNDPGCAEIVESAILFGDGVCYQLLGWVVMPDHVHLLLQQQTGWPLAQVIGDMKRFSALQCNRYLGRSGHFWTQEYWDRLVRNERQLQEVEEYIRWNPVKARLVEVPEAYRWSHAWYETRELAGDDPAIHAASSK